MRHRTKFKKKYLKENQSLKYQIMLFFMEEHKRARLGIKPFIGEYFGDDKIEFDDENWVKICDLIENSVSQNHKNLISEMKTYMPIDRYIYSMMENQNYCYRFEEYTIEDISIKSFKLTADGHSYQYNGYMKSQDKSNKINTRIQTWLVILTVGILFYYIGSWFIPNLNLSHFKLLFLFLKKVFIFFKVNLFSLIKIFLWLMFSIFIFAMLSYFILYFFKKIKDIFRK